MIKKIRNLFIKKEVRIEKVMAAPPMGKMLDNRVALVIGGTKGIGKAIGERFSQAGAKVIVVGRNISCENSSDDVNKEYIKFDINDIEAQESLLKDIDNKFGDIFILVNCAGIQSKSELNQKGFLDITEEDWDCVMNTNLKSTYFMCQKFSRYKMSKGTEGIIINICSVTGLKPRSTPYGISKWGLTDITRALGTTLGKYGIRVNGIAPGMVNTDMLEYIFKNNKDNYYRNDHPDGRCACVDDIANTALFLASDYSKHIAGEVIVCDGSEINK